MGFRAILFLLLVFQINCLAIEKEKELEEEIDSLITLLAADTYSVRQNAMEDLIEIGLPAYLKCLKTSSLASDFEVEYRAKTAAEAIENKGAQDLKSIVSKMLTEGDWELTIGEKTTQVKLKPMRFSEESCLGQEFEVVPNTKPFKSVCIRVMGQENDGTAILGLSRYFPRYSTVTLSVGNARDWWKRTIGNPSDELVLSHKGGSFSESIVLKRLEEES